MSGVNKIRYRTEKVVPEGGFGYIVMIAIAISFGCCWGYITCIGLMFNDLIKSVGSGTSAITTVMGFLSISLSLGALFANTITKTYLMRTTAILGGILFFLGCLFSAFATSVEHLIISSGVFLGIGSGFIIPSAFGTLNGYFIVKRTLMVSISQSITGLIIVGYPVMVQFLLDKFGFKGAMAIIAAINGQVIAGMLLMHPVKWHYKIIQVPDEESQPFISSNDGKNDIKLIVTAPTEVELNNGNANDEVSGVEEEIKTDSNEKTPDDDSGSELCEHHRTTEMELQHETNVTHKRLSLASVMSNGPIVLSTDPQITEVSKWQKVVETLDLTLLKDMKYLNIAQGVTLALFADHFFFMLQPMYLFELKISKEDTALIMSLTNAFDLFSRIFLSILSLFVTIKARYLYLFGTIGSIISRFVFLDVFDFTGLAIVSAVMGFFKTFIHLTMPLVFAEYLPKERFATGYGLFMFLQGSISFLLSPFIGWIRDITKSYVICFHTLSLFKGICAVSWLIEFVWFWLFPRKTRTNDEQPNEVQNNSM